MAAVAQSHVQNDVHPLLRHPRPIKRDSAKAQRMLGLLSEETLKELQREKSVTTRWLERPMYGHLEASDMEEEKDEAEEEPKMEGKQEAVEGESDSDLLDKWTNPDRPTTSFNPEDTLKTPAEPKTELNTHFVKKRPQPLSVTRPVSYKPQHLLSPEWTASPATMSPNAQGQRPVSSYPNSPDVARRSTSSQGSCECDHTPVHSNTWTYPTAHHATDARTERPASFHPQSSASFDSPPMQPRPRPTSFATYHQRNRSGSKIASSRGLRNNSYSTNYSRPMSGIAPKAIAGENIENDMLYQRLSDDEVGPPTPVSPAKPMHTALDRFESSEDKSKLDKKGKSRWSTIPQTWKNFATRRRSSGAAQEPPKFAVVLDDVRRMNLTQENLHHHENEVSQTPSTPNSRMSTVDLIPTPTYSPLDIKPAQFETPLPPPFAPWAAGPPSPAATADRRRSSGNSLSPNTAPSRLSVENVPQVRPTSLFSYRSSVVFPLSNSITPQCLQRPTLNTTVSSRATTPSSKRNTPTLERSCILCKTAKPLCEFVQRRFSANCWHEPATCVCCMQSWIEQCLNMQGAEGCTCPECGEGMAVEDVVFAAVSPLSGRKASYA
ncbi:hypothetical protein EJ02DRAFT_108261 [Clathrospora elynae]|uniref:Uncharacterized protein n=1 Tax=Clathrospora elynae TaxID=706981 RepID=A0A6A5SWE1_9PLEO|nr:hypothetical protein EJ02DRAFT_108261 [Clathrospora elynae]